LRRASILLCSLLVGCTLVPTGYAKRAPNLELKSLTGTTEKVADLRGSIVVINFWATWCGPCQEELPRLSKLNQEYAGKKVRFIAISVDEAKNRAKIDQFLQQHNPGLEVWIGGDLDMLERTGLGNVLPGTIVLDEQGEVISRVLGEAREEDIRTPLDWLLSGRSSPAPAATTKRY
jgi:thiol-disulfide isomerase/thioredoxin